MPPGGGGISDHGELSGLLDDDHPQYLLVSGSRAMAGDLNMGSFDITNVGLVDGVDISAHASRHENAGLDEISVAGLSGLLADDQNALAIRETSGPTLLAIAGIADGELLVRSGATVTSTATATPSAHAASHQDTGPDEINVAGLSGLLADDQNALAIRETSGPTLLTIAGIADGALLQRSGATVVGTTTYGLQEAYDASGAPPHITVDGTNLGVTVRDNATPVGDIFAVQSNSPDTLLAVRPTEISIGPSARRLFRPNWVDSTGRFGCEVYPDDFSITTATGTGSVFYTDASRTVTLNIPGGGGIGNDTAPGFVSFNHTARFEDTGFLFASQLLVNAAVQVECATNTVGPLYLFLDQYKTYADGGSRTCTQHNAMRAQPSWGPNINGGSITQTSAELYYAFAIVDATVGSASVTTLNYFAAKNPQLTAGGTIGTLNAFDIAAITGPTTIRGINSAMSSGTFINHTGTASSFFAGDVHVNDGISLVLGSSGSNRVELLRPSAGVLRMIGVGGTNNEGLDWDFDSAANNVSVTSTTTAGLNLDLVEFAIGPSTPADGTNNWFMLFAPGLRATQLAGDYSEVLFSSATAISVAHAINNFATWTINAPTIALGGGSIVNAANVLIQTNMAQGTNRYGLLITSNPTGGTLNYALRCTNGDARFDARVDINNGIALGGGAAATLGTIGGSGPTAAAQAQWLEIDIGGTPHWIAVWT